MISVIIPHLNQPEALERGLKALVDQKGATSPLEIIVVDNGSSELPTEICSRFKQVTLLQQPVPGPGPARNMGVAAAHGDLLAFIDADCVASPSWIASIEKRFAETPDATVLGGDVRILQDDPKRPTLLEAYESVFAFRMKKYIEEKGFTGGGNLAVRAWVFAQVGGFLGINIAEDTEWGQRASRMGYRVRYEPRMVVYHPARRTYAELTKKWDRHIAHDYQEIRAQHYWWPRWMLRALAVWVSPVAEVGRIAVSDRLVGIRSRLLAMAGVTRIRFYRGRKMLALGLGGSSSSGATTWNRS